MYFDWTYVILVLPAMLLSMWASAKVQNTFNKYSKTGSVRRITGAEAAQRVLRANGISDVRIEPISGSLTDHYDPSEKVVRLSQSVYGSTSVAAVGVACHEVGHAIQHAVGYTPVKVRTAIIPITNFGSKLSVPLIIGGLFLSSFSYLFTYLAYIGLACFALCAVFQLVTLPVEFNASRRALQSISTQGILTEEEFKGTKKVLSAAALTYVAALAVTLMQLLRFIILVNNRRR